MLNYKFNITDNINVSGIARGNEENYYNSIFYASTEGGLGKRWIIYFINSKFPIIPPDENEYTTVDFQCLCNKHLLISISFSI